MTTAFIGVGLSGDYGTSWQLQHLIGRARATEMMLLAARVDAETCHRLGLLNWIVEPEELLYGLRRSQAAWRTDRA